MSEENKDQQQTPTEKKPRRKQPVVIYMIILMAAVVVLLLISYGMQMRSSQQLENLTNTVEGLEDSYTVLERINEMQGKIDTLTAQVSSLEDQLEEANDALDQKEEEVTSLTENVDSTVNSYMAMSYFSALQKAYGENDYKSCQAILTAMEAETEEGTRIVDSLPSSSQLGETYTYSPKEIYTAISEDVSSVANAGDEDPESGEPTDNMGSPEG